MYELLTLHSTREFRGHGGEREGWTEEEVEPKIPPPGSYVSYHLLPISNTGPKILRPSSPTFTKIHLIETSGCTHKKIKASLNEDFSSITFKN
jgi:hypothetical protein